MLKKKLCSIAVTLALLAGCFPAGSMSVYGAEAADPAHGAVTEAESTAEEIPEGEAESVQREASEDAAEADAQQVEAESVQPEVPGAEAEAESVQTEAPDAPEEAAEAESAQADASEEAAAPAQPDMPETTDMSEGTDMPVPAKGEVGSGAAVQGTDSENAGDANNHTLTDDLTAGEGAEGDYRYEIFSTEMNSNLEPGAEQTITVSVRQFQESSGDYQMVQDVHFRWYYDDSRVEILDAEGNKVGNNDESGNYIDSEGSHGDVCDFVIRRLSTEDTGIHLEADYLDQDGSGGNLNADYWLNRKNYNVRIEMDDNRVYNDGDSQCAILAEGFDGSEYEINVRVGYDVHSETDEWEEFEPGTDYSYDPENGTLTLNGPQIWEKLREYDDKSVVVIARVLIGGQTVCMGERWLQACEARADYEKEEDRSMLPGWDGTINGEPHVYVENAVHPNGEDLTYLVTNVQLLRDDPVGDAQSVFSEFRMDHDIEENYWWYYRVENPGEAEVEVFYRDLEGNDRSYTFTIYVGADVYNVDIRTEDGSDMALPGETVTLYAQARHESTDHERHGDISGVTYEWDLVQGEEYAELTADEQNPQIAYLTVKDFSGDMEDFWEDIRVESVIYDGTDEDTGEPLERARGNIRILAAGWYYEVWPTDINRGMHIGQAMQFETSVRSRTAGTEGYENVENVHYRWYYDPNKVVILDSAGQMVGNNTGSEYNDSENSYGTTCVFTIARRTEEDADIRLETDFVNKWGDEDHRDRNFHLDRKDYKIWFDKDPYTIYEDYETSMELEISDAEGLDYSLQFQIGCWNDEEENWDFLIQGQDVGVLNGDVFTINGADLMAALEPYRENVEQRGGVNVRAFLVNYDEQILAETWTWLEVRDSCHGEHTWLSAVVLQPTAEREGSRILMCRDCMEIRYEKIPKLIDISAAVVSEMETKAYTGKRIRQTPDVFVDGQELELGTDYLLSYANNVNAGTDTAVMTVRGIGAYTGTLDVNFTIDKAAQSAFTATPATSTLLVGKTAAITADGNVGAVTYASSDATVATVTSAGVVTAKKVGTAKITVTAAETDNYKKAAKAVTIKVVPGATASLTAVSAATGVKLTWKKVTGATGYKVYRGSTLVKKVANGSTSTVNFTDTAAKTNLAKYTYKIVPYAASGDSTATPATVTTYFLTRGAMSSATSTVTGRVTAKWVKNAKATGYQVQYSLSSTFSSGNKAVTVKGAAAVSKVLTGLTSNKAYYVRVRAYRTVSGKNYYSEWSAAKKVIVK